MSVYRVLVSFNAYRVGDVVDGSEFWNVDKHVRAGYLKPMEEVQHVEGTGVRNVVPDPVGDDLPVRHRATRKAKVTTDVEDRAVSDSGSSSSEE